MRLWAKTKAKELCSEWNMDKFFRLIHNDMNGICYERLHEMKAPGEQRVEIMNQFTCCCVAARKLPIHRLTSHAFDCCVIQNHMNMIKLAYLHKFSYAIFSLPFSTLTARFVSAHIMLLVWNVK